MRKRLKLKAHSCSLCKPFKMGWFNRWKNKDKASMKEFEATKKKIKHNQQYD